MFDENDILKLRKQLLPQSRAFAVPENGYFEKLLFGVDSVKVTAINELYGILDQVLPDNDNFTVDSARHWEQILSIYADESDTLANRKSAIYSKLQFPLGIKGRQHKDYLQKRLTDAGFNCKIYEYSDIKDRFAYIDFGGGGQFGDGTLFGDYSGPTNTGTVANRLKDSDEMSIGLSASNIRSIFWICGSTFDTPALITDARMTEFRNIVIANKPVYTACLIRHTSSDVPPSTEIIYIGVGRHVLVIDHNGNIVLDQNIDYQTIKDIVITTDIIAIDDSSLYILNKADTTIAQIVDSIFEGNTINCLAKQSDGKILVGLYGRPVVYHNLSLIRLNTDYSVDTTFVSSILQTSIKDIKVLDDDTILLACGGGVSGTNRGVFRLGINGSFMNSFDFGEINPEEVCCVEVDSEGRVYTGSLSAGVYRSNYDGTADNTWDSSKTQGIAINNILIHSDIEIWVACNGEAIIVLDYQGNIIGEIEGTSTEEGNINLIQQADGRVLSSYYNGIRRINSDKTIDTTFVNPVTEQVSAIAIS